ncbi:ABC transporter ATP-binding protein [Nocardia sp. 2]|uniref:ABC transporter ATP-binding protein n=1 Tax=Nocardia acididurans TaxID=2802282 RepID=A0ABS1MI37_9NOCA|nr:ABC transporter ATP-binding protein [Nocardia acididurans]MBL1080323.1 ABC transporter ATP-binding protein [Nocardia acididurans]
MTLRALDLTWTRSGRMVLDGVTLDPEPGSTVGLLGPNGSGKSSLLRLMAGLDRADSGQVLLDQAALHTIRRRQLARRIALVGQHADTELDLTVHDVVRLGRIPHRGPFGGDPALDTAAIDQALKVAGLVDKAADRWHTLSGGERQRTLIASALAQEPRELLLDEPTNHLDIAHQLEILTLVRALPVTAILALHDLNLAAMFCDVLVVLDRGRVVVTGSPAQVLTEDLIAEVYRVRCRVTVTDEGDTSVRFLRE